MSVFLTVGQLQYLVVSGAEFEGFRVKWGSGKDLASQSTVCIDLSKILLGSKILEGGDN